MNTEKVFLTIIVTPKFSGLLFQMVSFQGEFLAKPCISTRRFVRLLSISKVSLFSNLVTKVGLSFLLFITQSFYP